MSKLVLVTGAAGFIGSAVTEELSRLGTRVLAVDALLDGLYPSSEKTERFHRVSELPGVSTMKFDLRTGDFDKLPHDITHVINEAAMPGLSLSWSDFDLYSSCNISGLSRLLDASRRWPLEKFVQVSTSSVYGAQAIGDEKQVLAPVSPYGVTKLAAEHLSFAYWRESGIPATVLRYFSVYGPGQRPDMAYRRFITKALRGEPLTLFGSGKQSRTNTYIADCVSATVTALELGRPGIAYNISGSEQRSITEALEIIEGLVGHPLEIVSHDAVRGDQVETRGDSSLARAELGLVDSVTLETGLAEEFRWLQSKG